MDTIKELFYGNIGELSKMFTLFLYKNSIAIVLILEYNRRIMR